MTAAGSLSSSHQMISAPILRPSESAQCDLDCNILICYFILRRVLGEISSDRPYFGWGKKKIIRIKSASLQRVLEKSKFEMCVQGSTAHVTHGDPFPSALHLAINSIVCGG